MKTDFENKKRQRDIKKRILQLKAQKDLLTFITHLKKDYQINWHHRLIADKIDKFITGDSKRLMLFVPPQHGKSEIASRMMPAYCLGRYPNTKIAACSYSIDLARAFNRDVQRLIDTKEYRDVFPNTLLNSKRVASDSRGVWVRNTEEFEVVNHKGNYKAVGIMGGLSGRAVDLAIIDDPVKDRQEANSVTYRNRVWDWYLNVLEARLHNDSKVILIMTRWHEDDLAGRLLKMQPNKWDVIKIQAIKTDYNCEGDKRDIDEALWPSKHNITKLLGQKELGLNVFESLYQQNPTTEGGDIIKSDWFDYCHIKEVPEHLTRDLWIDSAYTNKSKNDPSGLLVCAYDEKTKILYKIHFHAARLEMPALMRLIKEYAPLHGLSHKSRVYIEPKASGHTLIQLINDETTLSAVQIKSKLVQDGKIARAQTAAPKYEAGKIIHVKGSWNDLYESQLTGFPNATHDEAIDLAGYSSDKYFKVAVKGLRRRN